MGNVEHNSWISNYLFHKFFVLRRTITSWWMTIWTMKEEITHANVKLNTVPQIYRDRVWNSLVRPVNTNFKAWLAINQQMTNIKQYPAIPKFRTIEPLQSSCVDRNKVKKKSLTKLVQASAKKIPHAEHALYIRFSGVDTSLKYHWKQDDRTE